MCGGGEGGVGRRAGGGGERGGEGKRVERGRGGGEGKGRGWKDKGEVWEQGGWRGMD